jgi:hypothetical protein
MRNENIDRLTIPPPSRKAFRQQVFYLQLQVNSGVGVMPSAGRWFPGNSASNDFMKNQ